MFFLFIEKSSFVREDVPIFNTIVEIIASFIDTIQASNLIICEFDLRRKSNIYK